MWCRSSDGKRTVSARGFSIIYSREHGVTGDWKFQIVTKDRCVMEIFDSEKAAVKKLNKVWSLIKSGVKEIDFSSIEEDLGKDE